MLALILSILVAALPAHTGFAATSIDYSDNLLDAWASIELSVGIVDEPAWYGETGGV